MSAEDIHWSADDCPDFRRRCRQIDARIRDDMQALLLAAEDMFRGWAEDGLLDRGTGAFKWSDETKRVEWRKMLRTPEQAVAHWSAYVRDSIMDARSLTAIEAEEVARGEP